MAEFYGFSRPIFEGFFEWVHIGALGAAIGTGKPTRSRIKAVGFNGSGVIVARDFASRKRRQPSP